MMDRMGIGMDRYEGKKHLIPGFFKKNTYIFNTTKELLRINQPVRYYHRCMPVLDAYDTGHKFHFFPLVQTATALSRREFKQNCMTKKSGWVLFICLISILILSNRWCG
jgi:hypothetical protein